MFNLFVFSILTKGLGLLAQPEHMLFASVALTRNKKLVRAIYFLIAFYYVCSRVDGIHI